MPSLAITPGNRLVMLRMAAIGADAVCGFAVVSRSVIAFRSRAAQRVLPRRGPSISFESCYRLLLRRVGDRGHQGTHLRRVPDRFDLQASINDLLARRGEASPD